MQAWGAASFDNDRASDWFYAVEEAGDPGAVMAAALDEAIGTADRLDCGSAVEAVAAAELCAACAGEPPAGLPDHIMRWVRAHPHQPAAQEIADAVQAVARVRSDSELSDLWRQSTAGEHGNEWTPEIDDLLARLQRCGARATDRPERN